MASYLTRGALSAAKHVVPFLEHSGARLPIICGAMYPCSNPELVAAASAAGGIGIVQPLSLVYVHGHDFREGIRYIHNLSNGAPIGLNAIVEKTTKTYERRMHEWVDIALDEGVRFFVTALGNPRHVVDKVHSCGGYVYHDVTERKWAEKALDEGVDGLICVNNEAGGHAGTQKADALFRELSGLGVPLVSAGGIGNEHQMLQRLEMGYHGVQMGTRFIATEECQVRQEYKEAILDATEDDIVLTDALSGVPCSIIANEATRSLTKPSGPITRFLLQHRLFKHWMRTLRTLRSIALLKNSSTGKNAFLSYRHPNIFQAGKSVDTINEVESVQEFMKRCEQLLNHNSGH